MSTNRINRAAGDDSQLNSLEVLTEVRISFDLKCKYNGQITLRLPGEALTCLLWDDRSFGGVSSLVVRGRPASPLHTSGVGIQFPLGHDCQQHRGAFHTRGWTSQGGEKVLQDIVELDSEVRTLVVHHGNQSFEYKDICAGGDGILDPQHHPGHRWRRQGQSDVSVVSLWAHNLNPLNGSLGGVKLDANSSVVQSCRAIQLFNYLRQDDRTKTDLWLESLFRLVSWDQSEQERLHWCVSRFESFTFVSGTLSWFRSFQRCANTNDLDVTSAGAFQSHLTHFLETNSMFKRDVNFSTGDQIQASRFLIQTLQKIPKEGVMAKLRQTVECSLQLRFFLPAFIYFDQHNVLRVQPVQPVLVA